MPLLTTRHVVEANRVDAFLQPRRDAIVAERADAVAARPEPADGAEVHAFSLAEGPFDRYERRVEIAVRADGRRTVTERIDYRLATPAWRTLLGFVMSRELRRRPTGRIPWWAPPDRFDATAARAIGLLCVASILTGYLGAVIGQTATFASDEFAMSDRAQGFLLAGVRAGTLITLAVAILADRSGRRRWLLASMAIGCIGTLVGAASTGPWTLGISQSVARGFATAVAVLIGIMAAEITPRNSRAYVASVLTLTAGLGAGMVVWFLPIADAGERGWRLLYLLPIVGLPLTWWTARSLVESSRFTAALERGAQASGTIVRSRLVLVAAIAFLTLLFAAPASQFRNEFLTDERGFTATQVSLFVLATHTPVGIGVAFAGKLADRRGRRPIGAIGVGGGTVLVVLTYFVSGWGMWAASVLGSIVGAMAVPALGVYQAEMFGTGRRGRANGIITVIALAGSALGLLIVGDLSERFGSFAPAFALVALAPMVVVGLVLTLLPETAHLELEELNPQDAPPTRPR